MRMMALVGSWLFVLVLSVLSPAKAAEHCAFSEVHQEILALHSGLVPRFEQYAKEQGYFSDCAQQVVALHEMLHLVGVQNDGFVFESALYQPRFVPLWQSVTFADLVRVIDSDSAHTGLKRSRIFQDFLVRNPESTLDVLLDEVGAYSQTLGYIQGDAAARHYRKRMNEHRQAFLVGWSLLDPQAKRVALSQYRDFFKKLGLKLKG